MGEVMSDEATRELIYKLEIRIMELTAERDAALEYGKIAFANGMEKSIEIYDKWYAGEIAGGLFAAIRAEIDKNREGKC